MMRMVVFLALAVFATASFAQRPSTLGMGCSEAQSLVAASGAIVLSTGRHTYDRYVAHPGFCAFGEYAYSAYVPTSDARQCPVGYECRNDPPLWRDDNDGGFFRN